MKRWSKLTWVLGFLVMQPAPTLGQVAHLVSDLTRGQAPQGAYISDIQTLGNRVLYHATQGPFDNGVWSTDGTVAGTELLFLTSTGGPTMGTTPERIFWSAYGNGVRELWTSDGTAENTGPLLAGLGRGDNGTLYSDSFATYDGSLFFYFESDEWGAEPWVSDGTPEGTGLFADIVPGPDSSSPREFTATDDGLFFVTDEGARARLWKTNGVELVSSVRVSRSSFGFSAIGDKVLFGGPSDALWVSDGTEAGTSILFGGTPEIRVSPWGLSPVGSQLIVPIWNGGERFLWGVNPDTGAAELLFSDSITSYGFEFLATDEFALVTVWRSAHEADLWVSDGTAAGTRRLEQLCPECSGEFSRGSAVVAGSWVFVKLERTDGGSELWALDGPRALPVRVETPAMASIEELAVYREDLYLSFSNLSPRPALWKVSAGATVAERITAPELTGSRGLELGVGVAQLGNRVFYSAQQDSGVRALWATGDQPGDEETLTFTNYEPHSTFLRGSAAMGSRLLTWSYEHLWASGGTDESTVDLGPANNYPGFSPVVVDGAAFFRRYGDLWITEGDLGSTRRLSEVPSPQYVIAGAAYEDGVVFATRGGDSVELWRSDGSEAGTAPVLALPSAIVDIRVMASFGSALYLLTNEVSSGSYQYSLWTTDLTPEGTVRLTDPSSKGGGFSRTRFVELGDQVLLLSSWVGGRVTLYSTDGTAEGTTSLVSGLSDFDRDYLEDVVVIGDRAHAIVTGFDGVTRLWATDGTPDGTQVITELPEAGLVRSLDPFVTAMDDRIFFAAGSEDHGVELWSSDGTAAGTALLHDLVPGRSHSRPESLAAAGGALYFSARDVTRGWELWVTDGTPDGARLVHDIAPGRWSSSPEHLVVLGDTLYFGADDHIRGTELWALPLAGETGCEESALVACLADGRFRAELYWLGFDERGSPAEAASLSDDTAVFYFANPDNLEAAVKVLDGRSLNGHFWAFYGSLSDVQYWLTLTDVETGATRRYTNPAKRFASVGDTAAFGPRGSSTTSFSPFVPPIRPASPRISVRRSKGATGGCVPTDRRLCLAEGRFAVEATWRDFADTSGDATAVQLTGDTGYFWFFREGNVEAMVKVLDGRPVNGAHWVFYGALSNVEYRLTVTDTATGEVKTYLNPLGNFGSAGDTRAFVEVGSSLE